MYFKLKKINVIVWFTFILFCLKCKNMAGSQCTDKTKCGLSGGRGCGTRVHPFGQNFRS